MNAFFVFFDASFTAKLTRVIIYETSTIGIARRAFSLDTYVAFFAIITLAAWF